MDGRAGTAHRRRRVGTSRGRYAGGHRGLRGGGTAATSSPGQLDAALDACQRALGVSLGAPAAHLQMARIYFQRGWRDRGVERLLLLARLLTLDGRPADPGRPAGARSAHIRGRSRGWRPSPRATSSDGPLAAPGPGCRARGPLTGRATDGPAPSDLVEGVTFQPTDDPRHRFSRHSCSMGCSASSRARARSGS